MNKVQTDATGLYETISKDTYNKARDEYNSGKIISFSEWEIGNIAFLASYNGKFFGGYAGIVHTKADTIRDYYDESRRNIINQSTNLKDVIFECADYKSCKGLNNAVIYCDPPYEGVTKYSTDINHNEFWDFCRNLSKNNIVLISEHNAPNDFVTIWQQDVIRTIDNKKRVKAIEKLYIHRCNI